MQITSDSSFHHTFMTTHLKYSHSFSIDVLHWHFIFLRCFSSSCQPMAHTTHSMTHTTRPLAYNIGMYLPFPSTFSSDISLMALTYYHSRIVPQISYPGIDLLTTVRLFSSFHSLSPSTPSLLSSCICS